MLCRIRQEMFFAAPVRFDIFAADPGIAGATVKGRAGDVMVISEDGGLIFLSTEEFQQKFEEVMNFEELAAGAASAAAILKQQENADRQRSTPPLPPSPSKSDVMGPADIPGIAPLPLVDPAPVPDSSTRMYGEATNAVRKALVTSAEGLNIREVAKIVGLSVMSTRSRLGYLQRVGQSHFDKATKRWRLTNTGRITERKLQPDHGSATTQRPT